MEIASLAPFGHGPAGGLCPYPTRSRLTLMPPSFGPFTTQIRSAAHSTRYHRQMLISWCKTSQIFGYRRTIEYICICAMHIEQADFVAHRYAIKHRLAWYDDPKIERRTIDDRGSHAIAGRTTGN